MTGTPVWIMIVNDRHLDTTVRVFADSFAAIRAIDRLSRNNGWPMDDPTPGSWLASCSHPDGDDHAFVVAGQVER